MNRRKVQSSRQTKPMNNKIKPKKDMTAKSTNKRSLSSSAETKKTTRVCIKNIPPSFDEMNLKKFLLKSSKFGGGLQVTDCKVLKTKNGVSRKLAFVGFKTSEMAEYVISYFNKSYARTSRLIVEAAIDITRGGGEQVKRSRTEENDHILKEDEEKKTKTKQTNKNDDKKKKEFVSAMMGPSMADGGGKSKFWSNDDDGFMTQNNLQDNDENQNQTKPEKEAKEKQILNKNSTPNDDDDDDATIQKEINESTSVSTSNTVTISDMDFLRSKVVSNDGDDNSTSQSSSESGSDSDCDSSSVPSSDSSDDDDDTDNVLKPQKQNINNTERTQQREKRNYGTNENSKMTDRLFLRNLPFCATQEEITQACNSCFPSSTTDDTESSKEKDDDDEDEDEEGKEEKKKEKEKGAVVQCHIPVDELNNKKGFAFVKFKSIDDAKLVMAKLDGAVFQGRLLHILPAREERGGGQRSQNDTDEHNEEGTMTYKKRMELARQKNALTNETKKNSSSSNFVRGDAVGDNVANRLGFTKGEVFNVRDGLSSGDAAVRLALGETHVIEENRKFFTSHGIDLDALDLTSRNSTTTDRRQQKQRRSQTMVLVKNLPYDTTKEEITKVCHTGGDGDAPNVLLPPSRTIALLQYSTGNDAKRAFRKLAYRRFKHVPLYLEWAPLLTKNKTLTKTETLDFVLDFEGKDERANEKKILNDTNDTSEPNSSRNNNKIHGKSLDEEEAGHSSTLYVKNLNFKTTEEGLSAFFENSMGQAVVRAVTIPTKVAPIRKIEGKQESASQEVKHLSKGYGFVEMKSEELAHRAIKNLQGKVVDGHYLELQLSAKPNSHTTGYTNTTNTGQRAGGSKGKDHNRKSTKLMVRNVPFQASRMELLKLFGSFGQLRTVRLPKKFDGSHRGFAFVQFITAKEAQNAMKALSQTHLYGRHLVLEWAEDKDDIETLRGKAARDAHAAGMMEKTSKQKKIRTDGFT